MHPTYASKFPPGQGLLLALGSLFGSPRVGPVLALAIGSVLTTWMMAGVCSRRWAIVGGLLAGLHPQSFQWSQTFWGGGGAMCGGALLAGCAIRVERSLRERRTIPSSVGVLFGIALALIASMRPFEGAILVLLLAGWLVL